MSASVPASAPTPAVGGPRATDGEPSVARNPPTSRATPGDIQKPDPSDHSQQQSSLYSNICALEKDIKWFRAGQLFAAYSVMTVSIVCTFGTAVIGIASAVLSFNDHSIASKATSLLLAGFGVALSLLKGTGQPANAFMNVVEAEDILDDIQDIKDGSGTKTIMEVKTAWRKLRDNNNTERASVWKNLQK